MREFRCPRNSRRKSAIVTPYVSIAEARASSNSVQVKGLLDKTFAEQQTCDEFTFGLVDETTGETLRVKFDDAYHVVAIGKYDAAEDSFHAKKLLIKCPSKYEGQQPR